MNGAAPPARALRRGALAALLALAIAAPAMAEPGAPVPGAIPMVRADDGARGARPRGPGGTQDGAPTPPASLADLSPWLDYRARSHLTALPMEARLFYRRGLLLHASGAADEALRLVRGAAELDPGYVAPHLTLASWFLFSEPSQALQQYATVLELSRQSFALQLAMCSNLLYLVVQSLFLGLLAAGLLLLVLHQPRLRHAWSEHLTRFVSPGTARIWAWGLLALPYLAGFGIALPTVALLGLLWPHLRLRERGVFVLLAAGLIAVPWIGAGFERLAAPVQEDRAPFYGVPLLQDWPDRSGQRERVARLAAEHPDNGFLQFAAASLARRDGDLRAAEAGYRRTLALWPNDDRALNNLGNVLAAAGRADEALACYQGAIGAQPKNAAAHFNASQIHTLRYEFHDATDELSRASALNFDMVKTYQSEAGADGWLPLVDQWISPRACWRALSDVPLDVASRSGLPPEWRGRLEASGLSFSFLALLVALLAWLGGTAMQRSIPLRACSNCGRTVCRRCAERRRERALCPACAAIDARAESPEFARVLLLQERSAALGRHRLLRTGLATLIPGYGLLAFRHVITPVLLLSLAGALATNAFGLSTPFGSEPRVLLPAHGLPAAVGITLWVALYLVSLGGYFALQARDRAQASLFAEPVRSRSVQSTHATRAAA